MAGQYIDRDKLRAAVRKMGTEYVFLMLDDAITLLPETKLRKLIAQYLNPHEFRCSSLDETRADSDTVQSACDFVSRL